MALNSDETTTSALFTFPGSYKRRFCSPRPASLPEQDTVLPSTPIIRAERDRARRQANLAARKSDTFEILTDRLPDYEPRVSFPALWNDLRTVWGILPRNSFYELLTDLDGAHLNEDLVVRIAPHERPSRRAVLIGPRKPWEQQRSYLSRYLARGHIRPPHPVSYKTAHARVLDAHGPAASHACGQCGNPAAEWSYKGFSPNEQVGWVESTNAEGFTSRSLRLWSPSPSDYEPLCWRCHAEADETGAIWGDAPRTSPPIGAGRPRLPLPASAPLWVRDLATRNIPTTQRAASALPIQRRPQQPGIKPRQRASDISPTEGDNERD